jgi:hypothetical protein
LENALDALILKHLGITDEAIIEKLYEQGAPLNSFFGKIWLGRMLGLYDDFLAENLHSIRRVRNAFAHARKPVSFASDQIIKECTSLKIADPVRKNMPKRPSLTARQLYIDYVIATLIHFNEGTLKIGAKNLQRMKREIRKSRQRQAKLAQLVLQVEEARES